MTKEGIILNTQSINPGTIIGNLLILEIMPDPNTGRLVAHCRCLCVVGGSECGQMREVYIYRLQARKEANRPKACEECTLRMRAERKAGKRKAVRTIIVSELVLTEPPTFPLDSPICLCSHRRYEGKHWKVINEECPIHRLFPQTIHTARRREAIL